MAGRKWIRAALERTLAFVLPSRATAVPEGLLPPPDAHPYEPGRGRKPRDRFGAPAARSGGARCRYDAAIRCPRARRGGSSIRGANVHARLPQPARGHGEDGSSTAGCTQPATSGVFERPDRATCGHRDANQGHDHSGGRAEKNNNLTPRRSRGPSLRPTGPVCSEAAVGRPDRPDRARRGVSAPSPTSPCVRTRARCGRAGTELCARAALAKYKAAGGDRRCAEALPKKASGASSNKAPRCAAARA